MNCNWADRAFARKDTRTQMFHFHLAENGTTVKTEIIAGITTFLSMVYILAVYPSVMGARSGSRRAARSSRPPSHRSSARS